MSEQSQPLHVNLHAQARIHNRDVVKEDSAPDSLLRDVAAILHDVRAFMESGLAGGAAG